MTNIPHGYNDEGGRGLSDREVEKLERHLEAKDNKTFIEGYNEQVEEFTLYCYNCTKKARPEGARIVGSKAICEDCYADLNLKKN